MNDNLITVITICFNNLNELKETMHSVDIQLQKPFEHWIINGSTNTEIENYLENNTQPIYRKWINERDKGISDAFNKGIKNALGDIVVMLNSGDTFFNDNTIETVSKAFITNSSIKWLHSKYKLRRGNNWVVIGKPFEESKLYRGMRSICHQTMFVKKELHTVYGLYDEKEKIAMDYDFLCRIANEPFIFIPTPLVTFAPEGTSSINYLQSVKDIKRVYEKYYNNPIKVWIWQLRLKFLYYLIKSPIGNYLYNLKTKLRLENM